MVWVTAVVTFSSAVLVPLLCKVADYYGRKWLMVAVLVCGFVGCLVVSRAETIGTVLIGQTTGGLGQSVQALSTAVSSEVLPRKYRGWAQASLYAPSAIAAIISIYSTGAMTKSSPEGFRNYWYMCAAVYFASACLIAWSYNPPTRELQKLPIIQKIYAIDLPGCALVSVALLGICLALSWSDNPYGWSNARVLAPFVMGWAAIAVFV